MFTDSHDVFGTSFHRFPDLKTLRKAFLVEGCFYLRKKKKEKRKATNLSIFMYLRFFSISVLSSSKELSFHGPLKWVLSAHNDVCKEALPLDKTRPLTCFTCRGLFAKTRFSAKYFLLNTLELEMT